MEDIKLKAAKLLDEFKGGDYIFGPGVSGQLGEAVAGMGKKVSVVADGIGQEWAEDIPTLTIILALDRWRRC